MGLVTSIKVTFDKWTFGAFNKCQKDSRNDQQRNASWARWSLATHVES